MKWPVLIFALFTFGACEFSEKPAVYHKKSRPDYIWVYVKMQSEMKLDTSDYFLYGQITKDAYERISNNETNGNFVLNNMRYYNDSDKLDIVKDDFLEAESVFRIKDIVKLDVLRTDPLLSTDSTELTEKAARFLKENK